MSEEEKHHQARELEKVFQEVQKHESKLHHPQPAKIEELDQADDSLKLDVLNLPPRRSVHQEEDTGFKIKFSPYFWRFILIILVLIVISGFIVYDRLF